MDKLFIIAIGGTGMRCLESFVHLCAAGLFDNQTIDILTLDTDQNNGNKGRVERLINLYNKVKTNDENTPGGEQRNDNFFSAKLNLYTFWTNYSNLNRRSLKMLAGTSGNVGEQQDNQDLLDLMFDRDTVQEFPLDRGYRAQTHLGSMLMYHGIIEAARNAKKGGETVQDNELHLMEFLEVLGQAAPTGARVFVFGSVFGGTGASSIPVIPHAIKDALEIINKTKIDLKKVKFGSTLLTDYFTFGNPTEQQLQEDKVIADSNNFALNSQAALSFYWNDPTVKNGYRRLYHIGWPSTLKADYSNEGDVVTGGEKQENKAHVVELLSAAAAYDFFTEPEIPEREVEYVFRRVGVTDNNVLRFTGASFIEDREGKKFEEKLGALLSTAYIILSRHEGARTSAGTQKLLDTLRENKITAYETFTLEQAKEIDEYLREFAFKIVDGAMIPGWIYQIKESVRDAEFLFRPNSLPTSISEAMRVDPGNLFIDDKHNWVKEKMFVRKSPEKSFDVFLDAFKVGAEPTPEQGSTMKERFLANMYNAIRKLQKFENL